MTSRAFGFQIEEQTGGQRSIVLRGRALPYRGVTWEGTQKTKQTWYPGNPQATQQVLGPTENPTTIRGIWKDRFLPGQVEISGSFGQPIEGATITAEQLAFAFDQLRVAGNLLRVQWGPLVRNGILRRFRVEPARIEDWTWEAEFEWSARNDAEVPRAAEETDENPDLRQKLNEVDDQLAFEPPQTLSSFSTEVSARVATLRTQAGVMFDRIRQTDGLTSTPAEALGALASAAEAIRTESEELLGQLSDVPYLDAQTTDRVLDVLSIERWRRTLGERVFSFRATAQRLERAIQAEARPSALAVITVPGDTSLRTISRQVYGTADSWQVIADFNGFETSIVPAGTTVVIPPAPVRAGGVQRADLPT